MNRRSFLSGFIATASGLLVPEPVRAYSFLTDNPLATELRAFSFVYTAGEWRALDFLRVPLGMPDIALPILAHEGDTMQLGGPTRSGWGYGSGYRSFGN